MKLRQLYLSIIHRYKKFLEFYLYDEKNIFKIWKWEQFSTLRMLDCSTMDKFTDLLFQLLWLSKNNYKP